MPPLQILDPLIRTSFNSDPVSARIRYNSLADKNTLTVLLNGQQISIGSPGDDETLVALTAATGLLPGKNVLSAYVESSDPTAVRSTNVVDFPGKDFLVRHRVFFFQDADLDSVPDSVDVSGPGPDVDNDNDGLPDSAEARVDAASGKITGTDFGGTISISAIMPNPAIPGHTVTIFGAGMEAIDLPAEILFGVHPATDLLYTSPTAVVVRVPPELDGQASTIVTLQDLAGSSAGAASASLGMEAKPPTDVSENLVLVAGIHSQIFQNANLEPVTATLANVPFFNNLLQFGSETRVLIDASLVEASLHPWIVPLGPPSLESLLGADSVTVRRSGILTPTDLSGIDLLIVLNAVPAFSGWAASEIQAIANWVQVPGRRLVVFSDANNPGVNTNAIANQILEGVGADAQFDELFPNSSSQNDTHAFLFPTDLGAPFTPNFPFAFYYLPTSITLAGDAEQISRQEICFSDEEPILEFDPVSGFTFLVGCLLGETEFPPFSGILMASETIPTTPLQTPTLEIQEVGGTTSGVSGAGTLITLSNASSVNVRASFTNLPFASYAKVNGMDATIQFTPGFTDRGEIVTTVSVPIDPIDEPLAIRVTAGIGEPTLADTIVVRNQKEQVHVKMVTLRGAPKPGAPEEDALALSVRQDAIQQAGLEWWAMCSSQNGATLDPAWPGLEPTLEMDAVFGASKVSSDTRFSLTLLDPEGEFTAEAVQLLSGLAVGGAAADPNLPQPGVGDVRVIFVREFLRQKTGGGTEVISSNPETGDSTTARAVFIPGVHPVLDAVLIQTTGGDPESGAMVTARPTVSTLSHELAHVVAGMVDNPEEVAGEGLVSVPVNLPAILAPGIMNSFPYRRSTNLGDADVADCNGSFLSGVTPELRLAEFCQRAIEKRTCAGVTLDFTR